jgi:hypothetical protein
VPAQAGAGHRGDAHVKRTVLGATALAAGIGLLAAGCGGSASGAAATTSGTETITGTLNGTAAMASNPVFHLTFRGPVNTTATFPLGSSPKKGQAIAFKTAAGNFAIVSGTSSGIQKLLSASTCRFEFATTVPYTVSGAKSTGKFAGATGSGKAVVLLEGNLPKLTNGKCNTTSTAQPAASTVVSTFRATGPLTLK